jgi:hypothetical protein
MSFGGSNALGMYAVLCFKEGTKILTENGYILIENLRKGDCVQTLKDGLKKIEIIRKTRRPAAVQKLLMGFAIVTTFTIT